MIEMKMNVRENEESASRIRMLIFLVISCVFCAAMVPAVAAMGTYIDNSSVTVNESYFDTIEGTDYNWNHFFGVLDAAGYSYTWSNDTKYDDRKYLETLTIGSTTYPAVANTTDDFKWKIVNDLDKECTLYKKCLAGWVDPLEGGDYYLWFGNDTAARSYYNGYDNWLFPTAENATYIVKIGVSF